MLAFSANIFKASSLVIFLYSETKSNTLPPLSHPKHLNICFSGLTIKEGVFSPWKGQQALKLLPCLLNETYSEIMLTISDLFLISSQTFWLVILSPYLLLCDAQ